jgi:pimeloyl-ACP methyl ester carboxylesterase
MKTLHVNGIALRTIDEGAGTPVLFVHGFPLSHSMWRAQIDLLRDKYRAIVPDLRGFGQSSVTAGTVTMEQFADDLAELLDTLGVKQPVVLCGLSMGGYIAFQFVKKYRSRLRGLVLCDTRSIPDSADGAAGRRKLAATLLEKGAQAALDAMQPKLFAAATPERMPAVVEEVRQMILATSPQGMSAALLGMAERPDSSPVLPTIDVPTLVLAGAEDRISPPDEMRQIAGAIPGARFVEIPQSGHLAPMENPAAVNAALQEFLTAVG